MNIHDHQLCIGAHASRGHPVMLGSDERRRHLYVIGQTGTGKSTLFLNLIQRLYRTHTGLQRWGRGRVGAALDAAPAA